MFDQSVIPKHHKHKTHDGEETGENRSLPRQLLKGVELTLLWCKTSDAEQQFTQHLRQWQKSSIQAEKTSHKEALDLTTRQITVNRKQIPNKKNTFHKCSIHVLISNITCLKRQMQRQERTGHFHVNSQRGVEHVLRWCE